MRPLSCARRTRRERSRLGRLGRSSALLPPPFQHWAAVTSDRLLRGGPLERSCPQFPSSSRASQPSTSRADRNRGALGLGARPLDLGPLAASANLELRRDGPGHVLPKNLISLDDDRGPRAIYCGILARPRHGHLRPGDSDRMDDQLRPVRNPLRSMCRARGRRGEPPGQAALKARARRAG